MGSTPESLLTIVRDWDDVREDFWDQGHQYNAFVSRVFPKLIDADLTDLIPRFEQEYAWLLDFRPPSEGFSKAHQKFDENPVDMVAVLKGYLGAWRHRVMNNTLAEWSRRYVDHLRNLRRQRLDQEHQEREHDQSWVTTDEFSKKNTSRIIDDEKLLQFGKAGSDTDFLRAFGNYDTSIIFTQYEALMRGGTTDVLYLETWKLPMAIKYRKTIANVQIFVNLLPGLGETKVDEHWSDTLLVLQKKIFEKPSGAIASQLVKNMGDEIRTLREENRRKEKELQTYRGIVSDLSFRHLLEMLAKASHDAQQASENRGSNHTELMPFKGGGSQKKNRAGKKNAPPEDPTPEISNKSQNASEGKVRDPQWQEFWKEAWSKASEGTKEGPLRDLWLQSEGKKDIRRGQIRSEGDRIFGLLSANIHDCEALFETEHCHDSIRRSLLDALKPLEKKRDKDGRIDWNEEVKRFI